MGIMNCPACQEVMTLHSRAGVVLDICIKCRSVRLDSGELDLIANSGRRDTNASLLPGMAKGHLLPAGASERRYWRRVSDYDEELS